MSTTTHQSLGLICYTGCTHRDTELGEPLDEVLADVHGLAGEGRSLAIEPDSLQLVAEPVDFSLERGNSLGGHRLER